MKECIERICPICHQTYTGYPATSRTDNETLICPDCGSRQALEMMDVPSDEIEHILGIIHQASPK